MYRRVHVLHGSHAHAHGNWVPRRHLARMRHGARHARECKPLAMCWVITIAVGITAAFLGAMVWITLK